MTEQELKSVASKMIEAAENDKKIKEDYSKYWINKFIKYVFVPIGYFLFFFILQLTCKPSTVSTWGYITAFIIDIPIMFIMFIYMKTETPRLSDGRKCFTASGFLLKTLCAFCSFSPFIFLLYGILYDSSTGRCAYPIWKIILYAPLIFIGLMVYAWFMNTSTPYSDTTDKNGNAVMTKSDYHLMRQAQEIAGLDPDKVPFVIPAEQAKKMTKSDWYMLGMDLELAGYKVFKK